MPIMMLRNSERSTWKKCRHRWEWTYLEGRQETNAPHALRFGDLVHRALERYYIPGDKRGQDPAEAFAELYAQRAQELEDSGFNIWSDEKWTSALDLGTGMLAGYHEEFKEADKAFTVLASEQTFQIVVKHPTARLDGRPFRFKVVGTFDGVWRHKKSGRIIFKEFKTAASIKLDGLALDEQAGTYWTFGPDFLHATGVLKPDQDLSEILYTFLRKAVKNPDKQTDAQGRYLNKDGSVSKVQPAPFFARVPVYRDQAERERMFRRICDEAYEIAQARRGKIPLYKNPGPLHMPNCLGCGVKDACEVHEAGGDYKSVLNASMSKWNPYAAHELPERQ